MDSSLTSKFTAHSATFELPSVPELGSGVDTISPKDDLSEGNPFVCIEETGVSHGVSFPLPAGHLPPRTSSPYEA